jgi:hypothetical protein
LFILLFGGDWWLCLGGFGLLKLLAVWEVNNYKFIIEWFKLSV